MDEPLNQRRDKENAPTIVIDLPRALAVTRKWAGTHTAEICCAVMLSLMSLQMLAVIWRKSITIDEIVMIPSAYYHLAPHNFQLVNEHTTLGKIISGIPFL